MKNNFNRLYMLIVQAKIIERRVAVSHCMRNGVRSGHRVYSCVCSVWRRRGIFVLRSSSCPASRIVCNFSANQCNLTSHSLLYFLLIRSFLGPLCTSSVALGSNLRRFSLFFSFFSSLELSYIATWTTVYSPPSSFHVLPSFSDTVLHHYVSSFQLSQSLQVLLDLFSFSF